LRVTLSYFTTTAPAGQEARNVSEDQVNLEKKDEKPEIEGRLQEEERPEVEGHLFLSEFEKKHEPQKKH
jgi:hypothetical protein